MSQSTTNTSMLLMLQKKSTSTWFAGIILAVLVIAVFGQFIFSDKMLFSSDQMNGLDNKVFSKTHHENHWWPPLWFSSRLSGMPSTDALFQDAFNPISIVLAKLPISVPRAIGYKMILHIFLAGLFFYLLLRKCFRMNQIVSITGAVFYMFNPQFFSHIYPGHDAKIYVIAWLPFIIWQLKRLMDAPGLTKAAWLGFGIGMSILTSQLQMTYFVMMGAGLYWCTAMGIRLYKKDAFVQTVKISSYFWLAVILGLCMGAVQVFPSMLYIRDAFSVRGAERGFDFAASWALHWPELFSLWVPELANTLDYYWGQNPFKLNSEYAGMVPLLLSVCAIVISPKNPWRIFWGAIAIVTALFALGAITPVFHIAYAIVPGIKKFRAASMIMFWFSFATILLSSLFLKDIASGRLHAFSETVRAKWTKGIFIAGAACIVITLLFSVQGVVKGLFNEALLSSGKERIFEANFSKNFVPFLWLWLMFSLAILGLVWAAIKNKLSSTVITLCILIIGMIDILRVDTLFIKLISPKPYFNKDETLTRLSNEMHQAPFRCYTLPGSLPSNGEGIYGLEGLGGFHDNELQWYRAFRGDQQDRNYLSSLVGTGANGQPYLRSEMLPEGNPFLNIANAKYLLARNGNQLLSITNKNALDRLSFVPGYVVMDSSQVPSALEKGIYDYRRKVALSKEPAVPEGFSLHQEAAPATNDVKPSWLAYAANYRKATFTAPADGFLRIAEVYYPGWEIRLDGKQVPYYRADLAWMAIPVASGMHTVELLPHSYYLDKYKFRFVSGGTALFMLALAIMHGLTASGIVKRGAHRKPEKSGIIAA